MFLDDPYNSNLPSKVFRDNIVARASHTDRLIHQSIFYSEEEKK